MKGEMLYRGTERASTLKHTTQLRVPESQSVVVPFLSEDRREIPQMVSTPHPLNLLSLAFSGCNMGPVTAKQGVLWVVF